MKVFKSIGVFVILLATSALAFYAYMGGFKTITVEKQSMAAMEIIYSTHQGPYENLEKSWTAFSKEFQSAGLEDCDALGIYLDKPDTPPEKLRSIIACNISDLDPELQTTLKSKFPTFNMPQAQAYASAFPYKNVMSFFMGPTKVYPKFMELIQSGELNPSVAIETYGLDEGRDKIMFYMPTDQTVEAYKTLFDAF